MRISLYIYTYCSPIRPIKAEESQGKRQDSIDLICLFRICAPSTLDLHVLGIQGLLVQFLRYARALSPKIQVPQAETDRSAASGLNLRYPVEGDMQ